MKKDTRRTIEVYVLLTFALCMAAGVGVGIVWLTDLIIQVF